MLSAAPGRSARIRRLAGFMLAALAITALTTCAPAERTQDRVEVVRPEPSYAGPVRQIRGQERLHRVESGDTMSTIAETHGLEPEAIEAINGLRPPYQLFVGEFLILPDTGTWVRAAAVDTVSAHPVDDLEAEPLPELE